MRISFFYCFLPRLSALLQNSLMWTLEKRWSLRTIIISFLMTHALSVFLHYYFCFGFGYLGYESTSTLDSRWDRWNRGSCHISRSVWIAIVICFQFVLLDLKPRFMTVMEIILQIVMIWWSTFKIVAEEPELNDIWTELLNSWGNEIYMKVSFIYAYFP